MDDFLERPPLEHITYKITNLRFQQKNHEIFFSPVLGHEGVVDKSLDEQGEGDDVEDKDVEDALSVVHEICSEHVPLLSFAFSQHLCWNPNNSDALLYSPNQLRENHPKNI